MGLVVIFCFLQVFIVIPHSLYIWDCIFLKAENCCFSPFTRLWRTRDELTYSTLPDVRMSDLASAEAGRDGEDDSGIDSNSNSTSDNISNTSSQSDDVTAIGTGCVASEENATLMVTTSSLSRVTVAEPVSFASLEPVRATFERKLTMLMQKGMLYVSVIPMSLNLYASKHKRACCLPRILIPILTLVLLVGISVGLLVQLRFDNKPPQFFDPNSNIQKMLDLAGNVTDSNDVNCFDCSAWNGRLGLLSMPHPSHWYSLESSR